MTASRQFSIAANSYITQTSALSTIEQSDWSLSFWALQASTGNPCWVMGAYDGSTDKNYLSITYNVDIDSANVNLNYWGTNTVTNSNYVYRENTTLGREANGVWDHWFITFDYSEASSDAMHAWCNGTALTDVTGYRTGAADEGFTTPKVSGTPDLPIGNYRSVATHTYRDSSIADICFWNRILTDAERIEAMSGLLRVPSTNLFYRTLSFGDIKDMVGSATFTDNSSIASSDGPPVMGGF